MELFEVRLHQLRKERRLTMQELGDALNLSKSSIASYEAGNRQPNLQGLEEIAAFFGTSTDYLLGLTDDPDPRKDYKDMQELLSKKNLHWNGRPLQEHELGPIKEILQMIVRDRLPKYHEEHDNK